MFPSVSFLKRSASALRSDERGTLAMTFAGVALTLCLTVGSAVDYGFALKVQSRLDGAADAASLAGARLISRGVTDRRAIEREVQASFDANFAEEVARGRVPKPLTIATDPATGLVEVTASVDVPTAFMALMGVDTMSIASTSASKLDSETIEVAMMLDTTGSMAEYTRDGRQKMSVLKSSARSFVDTLFDSAPAGSPRVRIALAPFASGVNAGPYATTVSAGASTRCVMERTDPARDGTDQSARTAPLRRASSCPSAAVVPLSTDRAALKSAISALPATGNTAGHLGTAWSYYLLSPKWADVFPAGRSGRAFGTADNRKIAVLMTDGQYNTYGERSNGWASSNAALAACDAMKADGITVYTIGFALNGQPAAKDLLEDCASTVAGKPAFYDADDAAALAAAYADIARQILVVRLSS
jgi:Flp pilus assembly protein TadG